RRGTGVKPPDTKAASSRRIPKRRQAAGYQSGVKPPNIKAASSRRIPKRRQAAALQNYVGHQKFVGETPIRYSFASKSVHPQAGTIAEE
ncbi:MAG TPA: hypothetical protein VMS31_18310, partial [Pyrinomonadaceae bacterium]|nr:hypothetical protein [Pyrinomonadaceae bacterium]